MYYVWNLFTQTMSGPFYNLDDVLHHHPQLFQEIPPSELVWLKKVV